MKSEVENEEYQEGTSERNVLLCFCCDFETENIDELDEHILSTHECEEVEDPDKKFEIVANEIPAAPPKSRKRQFPTAIAHNLPANIPRGKIIIRPHETKFEICEDSELGIGNDKFKGHRAKRAKRTPADEIQCHLCEFVTRKRSVLATHMLNHSDVIPPVFYRCSQCLYQTKRKNDMPKHMLGHCNNVLKYKCPHCSYQTKRKHDLPKHIICHKLLDSVPLHKCKYCPYVTKRKGDLPKHEMNHAERDKIFSWNCTECEYSSKRKNDLHKHMLIHSDRQLTGVFKCLKCAYATDKVVKFSRHVLSKCQVWDEPISLENLMLEDILAGVDKTGVHVVLETDSDGEAQVQEDNVQYVEEEGVEYVEYVEGIEVTEDPDGAVIIEGEYVGEEYEQSNSRQQEVLEISIQEQQES